MLAERMRRTRERELTLTLTLSLTPTLSLTLTKASTRPLSEAVRAALERRERRGCDTLDYGSGSGEW